MITQEYRCPTHGLFSLVEPCNEEESPRACPACGVSSPYTMSAPMTRVALASFTRGAPDERPPGTLDTRELGDGMPYNEWRAKQDAKWHAEDRDAVREALK